MKFKRIAVIAAASLAMIALVGCGKSTKAAADKSQVKVGILQLIDQQALTAARKGFTEELAKAGYKGNKIKLDYVNAQGDQSNLQTMSQRLKRDKNDLNLAIATPAAQALQKADTKTPMLFTAITDPKSAGLVSNPDKPNKNATGVTDKVDVAGQIKFIHKVFPKAKKIGLLFNAAEQNSQVQVKLAKAAIKKLGLTAVEKTAATTNDVEQSASALMKQSDVIYIPTDNTMAASMATIGKVSSKEKIPVVPADATMVKLAGVATVGINYEDLGKQTGKLAVQLLKGKKVKDLPVEEPSKTRLVINPERMRQFGLTKAMLEEAE
ncbi:ABC transporter substrate-binding protein [Lacticaseibacillus chiayiensis]|uniref:ABC transporter substrate-binding protein n=1 Tax=Lacticaseibacillus chiayiensis TaxID=2100821 RepID=A0A4V1P117_9LACO|nr:ABC transporter substrate-binding protein [Lacticaseibacillus chiayiensis]QVI35287.1 ABC transporter substrate-binding protein [Lacticaseibacillus chiayiensis]RXT22460.1 ABC transporter substrate-binding protein [Lacticaseibacillus chiayiensis]RXT55705.1 ABC transporter substrate-binding protein [Lacticaseibacillus chiayiensis]UYN57068.1 ABC transporter substrate-binding protein [Lacticaseibacillus chiayiensis]